MKIKWNEVTPFSKWAALIVFLLILPILAFYIGAQYNETRNVLSIITPDESSTNSAPSVEKENIIFPEPEEVPQAELQKLFRQAHDYIVKTGIFGSDFELRLTKYYRDVAVFEVISKTNSGALMLKKSGDEWEVERILIGDIWNGLSDIRSPQNDEYYIYTYADYNFDGFIDRALMSPDLCGATGNCPYFVQLYDPSIKKLRDPKGGEFTPTNPEVNEKEKIICSYANSSVSDYGYLIYKYSNDNFYPVKLIRVESDISKNKISKNIYTFVGGKEVLQKSVDVTNERSTMPECTLAQ